MKAWRQLLLLGLLAGCAARPEPHIYILGNATEILGSATKRGAGVRDDTGRKVIEVRPVLIPDYLDTRDIMLRTGSNELKASETGIWGERLSIGLTQALAGALARRVPSALVVASRPTVGPGVQILVDVTALEARPGGDCVLTAHWTIRSGNKSAALGNLTSAQGSFVTHADGTGDAAIVAAITRAVDELADQIAARLPEAILLQNHIPSARR